MHVNTRCEENGKAGFVGVWPFTTERVLFSGAAYPVGVLLKEAAREAASVHASLSVSFPSSGTISTSRGAAGNKYLWAIPNCGQATVPLDRVRRSPCFAQTPSAKSSACPIQFQLLSLASSLVFRPQLTALEIGNCRIGPSVYKQRR